MLEIAEAPDDRGDDCDGSDWDGSSDDGTDGETRTDDGSETDDESSRYCSATATPGLRHPETRKRPPPAYVRSNRR